MTKEEAIKLLEYMKKGVFPFSNDVMNELCNMAIEALSTEPCILQPVYYDRAISRIDAEKAVQKAFENEYFGHYDIDISKEEFNDIIFRAIRDTPELTPKFFIKVEDVDDISGFKSGVMVHKCKECKWNDE